MPLSLIKRNGMVVPWDIAPIAEAINKALIACDIDNPTLARTLAQEVENQLQNVGEKVHQEAVQNTVERVLMSAALYGPAKKYIIYRNNRHKVRDQEGVFLDIQQTIGDYLSRADWRVNENANIGFSFQGLTLAISGGVQAKYMLSIYPEEVAKAHEEGYVHLHDLSFGLAAYCTGWSLSDLLTEGFNLKGTCCSGPSKHFDSALAQMVNFIGTLQNEWAGAQAFNNVDTLLAPFIRYDIQEHEKALGIKLPKDYIYKYLVKQPMQRFIFNLNTTSRWGGQCPFSNLTFDLVAPKHIAEQRVVFGGEIMEDSYGDFQKEMDMLNKAFLEVMFRGDYHNRIFSFPIPTYNVEANFPWESEIGELLLKMTAKYGIPYFQNFINSELNPEDVRSMCCRLRMDLTELREHESKMEETLETKTGGLFGSGDLTGSLGVVTLNLPKLAYLAKGDVNVFFSLINKYANIAKVALEFKRKLLNDNLDKGMYPFSRRYLRKGFKSHFNTIGLIGGHEACLNLIDKGIETNEGIQLMQDTLNFLRSKMVEFQRETGSLFNLEATPAEGTSYRLAKIDRKMHPEIIASGNGIPYYQNSTTLPVNLNTDIIRALKHQDNLLPLYTGGCVFHTFLGESVADPNVIKNFIMKAFTQTKIPFLSITPTFSICEHHGYLQGEYQTCPDCGAETEIYTRVVGYYRPVGVFNKGKKAEYKDRECFDIQNTSITIDAESVSQMN